MGRREELRSYSGPGLETQKHSFVFKTLIPCFQLSDLPKMMLLCECERSLIEISPVPSR